MHNRDRLFTLTFAGVLSVLSACSSSSKTETPETVSPAPAQTTPFTLNFKAMSSGMEIHCDHIYQGFGPSGNYALGVTDLRFYISNLKFYDATGNTLNPTLDDNEFQLKHTAGDVALIDFSNKDSGYCALSANGTPRTNRQITGTLNEGTIAALSFDVGVPQAVMKAVIADTDAATSLPSPLAEMFWSWASGYRHFVLNFTTMDSAHTDMVENSGFHLGSRDCGGTAKALSEQAQCGLLNTPKVRINNFDPSTNAIIVNIDNLFSNSKTTDFVTDLWADFGADASVCIDERRNGTRCVTGQNFGMQCHSAASQAACASVFTNLGINLETGRSSADSNIVFTAE